jgi:hypothetical protein
MALLYIRHRAPNSGRRPCFDVLDELGDELVSEMWPEVPRVQLHVPLQHDVEEHLASCNTRPMGSSWQPSQAHYQVIQRLYKEAGSTIGEGDRKQNSLSCSSSPSRRNGPASSYVVPLDDDALSACSRPE